MSLVACSSLDGVEPPDESEPAPTSTSSAASEAPPEVVTTKATIGKVTGTFRPANRDQLRKRVVASMDAWIDAAYVAGDYPRTDFTDAFSTFSLGAERRAKRDTGLMSNATVGAKIDDVEVLERRLTIDVLAVNGQAAGVTVQVLLGLRLTGEIEREDRITGRVYMTYSESGWQVFGYDIERGQI